jgi:hypothetical protein
MTEHQYERDPLTSSEDGVQTPDYKEGDIVRYLVGGQTARLLVNCGYRGWQVLPSRIDARFELWAEPYFELVEPPEPELSEGDRVSCPGYGEGVIPEGVGALDKLGAIAYVDFPDGPHTPVALSLLTQIEPEEEDEESLNAAFVASIGQLKLQTPPCCGCLKDLNYGASHLSATCICGRYKKMLSGNIFHCAFPEPPTVVQNNGSEPLKEQETEDNPPRDEYDQAFGNCVECDKPWPCPSAPPERVAMFTRPEPSPDFKIRWHGKELSFDGYETGIPNLSTPAEPKQEKSLREKLDESLPDEFYDYHVDDIERTIQEHFDSKETELIDLLVDVADMMTGDQIRAFGPQSLVRLREILFGDS